MPPSTDPNLTRATASDPSGALEDLVANCLDAELRGDHIAVEALLLAQPAHAEAARAQLADLARTGLLDPLPTEIGPYRVRHLLGRGGMGEVFLAEQSEPVQRLVAVKLVKRGMDTREILARFSAERQALARMNHPAIARVFDAGSTSDGRPYFAMEYVAGQPIQTYCDQRNLDTQQRLDLFLGVCEGVQHAHLKGILHRDLKPSNLLVAEIDGHPRVKVIDFGISKAIDEDLAGKTHHTTRGMLLGTPEYMSPEQATSESSDLDLRSDIYSLGVVLYELLTGELPFSARHLRRDLSGLRRSLLSSDPPLPSKRVIDSNPRSAPHLAQRRTTRNELARRLRGDLDAIVLKALARERTERYASVGELAADLRRHLNHEPVLAAAPSRIYRLRKFVRRYRLQVGTAALVVAALLTGLIVSTIYRRSAEDAAARAARALSAEQHARGDAELQFARAWNAVDTMLRRVADERLRGVPQAEPVRRAILDDAARFCDELLTQRGEDARTLELSAATRLSLAELASRTLDPEIAERESRYALDLLSHPRAQHLPLETRLCGRSRAHLVLASVHKDALRPEERDRSIAEASSALAELLALQPAHADGLRLRGELALIHVDALLESAAPEAAAALDAARVALDEWSARAAPTIALRVHEVAIASCAADHALARQDRDAARAAIARGERAWESADASQRESSRLRGARLAFDRSRGNLLLAEQRYAEALPIARELITLAEELASQHPSIADYRRSVGYGFSCLGVAQHRLGQLEEAQSAFRRACEILYDPRNQRVDQPRFQLSAGMNGTWYASVVLQRRDAAALEDAIALLDRTLEVLQPQSDRVDVRRFFLSALHLRSTLPQHLGRPADGLAAAEREAAALCADLDLESASVDELARVGERLGLSAVLAHFAGAPELAQRFLEQAEPFVRKLEQVAPKTADTRMTRGTVALPAGLLAAARGDALAAWRATKIFAEQAATLGDDTRALALHLFLCTARCASGKLRESCLGYVESWCRDELGAMEENPARFARVLDLPQLRRDFELCLGIERALRGDAEEALRCFDACLGAELELARSSFVRLLPQDRLALALELRAELAAKRADVALRDASLSALAELALPEHAVRAAELALRYESPALALELLEARAQRRPAFPRSALESAALRPLDPDERFRALRDSLR